MSDYQVVNPATAEVEKEYPTATDAEVQDALARSHAAYGSWRTTSKAERADDPAPRRRPVRRARRRAGRDHRPRDGQAAARGARASCELVAVDLPLLRRPRPRPARRRPARTRRWAAARWSARSRSGPLLGIMPWNFPYYQVARFAAPNLMVGNTILLKHAPQCPESALAMEQIFRRRRPARRRLHQPLRHQRAGRRHHRRPARRGRLGHRQRARRLRRRRGGRAQPQEGRARARRLRPVHRARRRRPRCRREGRRRAAGWATPARPATRAKRMIVVDELYDDFVEQFTAAMADADPGRPVRRGHRLRPALLRGAPRRTSSSRSRTPSPRARPCAPAASALDGPGAFVEATVLTDVTPDMRAYREELFGPAAVVYRVADADEAVALANDSSFGLGGVVWSAGHREGAAGRRPARHRHGLDQQRPGLVRGPAVRRHQALRRRPRARPLRHRRVRQQEAHLHARRPLTGRGGDPALTGSLPGLYLRGSRHMSREGPS